MEEELTDFMSTMEDYSSANGLTLTPKKTQVLLVTTDQIMKDNFGVLLNGKVVKHIKEVNILGITLSENLIGKLHVARNLLPTITNQVRTYKHISQYLCPKFRRMYANACY